MKQVFRRLLKWAAPVTGMTALACSLILFIINSIICINGLFKATLVSPPATPLFEDRNGEYLTDLRNSNNTYGFWDINGDIPVRISNAITIIEDKRFFQHPGIDLRSVLRSLVNNISGNRIQGASTIAMQVARMQYPGKRTYFNKLTEMYTGFFLVLKYGHRRVLGHYLKLVPQGNQMHGVAYAARRYFRKPLEDLSWAEAAILAAILKSPGKMNLFRLRGFFNVYNRARMILNLLLKENIIDPETYKISLAELSSSGYRPRESRPSSSYHYLLRLIETYDRDEKKSYSRPVRTALDLDIQEYIQEIADYAMDHYRPYGAGNISIIVADKNNGSILGYIGSQDYYDTVHSGSINYAATPRSSGSTLKPFLYALGLQERHFTPASVIPDLPLSILSPRGEYFAGNFDDEYLGPMLYRRALANSRNIPTIRVLEKVGIEKTYSYFKRIGLTDGERPADYYGYGLALGGLYVTLEQLMRAYGILANEGKSFSLHWIPPVDVRSEPLFSESAARQITLFLSDTLARMPSFPRLSTLDFSFPVAVKTGTSQGFRDAWSVAYSSKYIVGVWMGHPENDRMNHVSGSVSTDLLQRIFKYLQPDESRGINEIPFPLPDRTLPQKVCILSGKTAGIDCRQVSIEYFKAGYEPNTLCNLHHRYAIDKRTGYMAGNTTPPEQVAVKTYTVFPPEYAVWAAGKGYTVPLRQNSSSRDTTLTITSPREGSRLIIDPATPRQFQSIALQAEVTPAVQEIIWMVDGKEYTRSSYPYQTRWKLEEGPHIFQAKFARAHIYSEKIAINIKSF